VSVAGRHGKLCEGPGDSANCWGRIEDLLTADVFGAYRYLPVGAGVGALLARATSRTGQTLQDWFAERGQHDADEDSCQILFWPTIEGKEPDVLVVLERAAHAFAAVLVEVKLHSPQHWIDGRSQLGFYASAHARGLVEHEQLTEREIPSLRPVVFLTKHASRPDAELEVAETELKLAIEGSDEVAGGFEIGIFWVSWQTALELAYAEWERRKPAVVQEPHWRLLEDLITDLEVRAISLPRSRLNFPLPALGELPKLARSSLEEVALAPGPKRPQLDLSGLLGCTLPEVGEQIRDWRIRR